MPFFFAAVGTPLACFIDGAMLAVSVYLVAKGDKGSK